MLATIILSALALGSGPAKTSLLGSAIPCVRDYALAQVPGDRTSQEIAVAAVEACQFTLERLTVEASNPEAPQRERDANTGLRTQILLRMRELAVLWVEKERARP
jgi:hypothetical protein